MVEGDTQATIANIAANQFLFRMGATYDILLFIGVIILSAALYNVLKGSNRTIALLFEVKDLMMNIVFTYLGFGSVLFCYLFFKTRFIPRILAAFGIFSFLLVFGESIAVMLFSVKSTIMAGVSAILFEIIIGIWLTVKGVDLTYLTKKLEGQASA